MSLLEEWLSPFATVNTGFREPNEYILQYSDSPQPQQCVISGGRVESYLTSQTRAGLNVIFDRGAYLPDLGLWLDSRRKRPVGYISHAHMDHVARHQRPILTSGTRVLLKTLLQRSDPCTLEYGETYDTANYSLTLYPAGHCLGSAQVLVRSKVSGQRVLYTGDFKVRPNPTAEPLQSVSCDTLIIESTFGRPEYCFPPQEEVLDSFFETLRGWLNRGETPVVLAYRMGKSQELLHHLLSQGFEVALEESAYVVTQSYQEAGVEFPGPFRSFDGTFREGEVLLFPPGKDTRAALERLKGKRMVAMSGWAVHNGARYRLGVDEAFPFSDHADYSELVDYVKLVNPKQVYTINGFPDLASHLRAQGYQAEHLKSGQASVQLKLL